MISKSRIVRQIIKELSRALETLAGAARVMHADASDEQNKAEDQYDTRGLETAYLASSQSRQATETEQALAQYQSLKLQKFTIKTPIELTALVELESHGTHTFYFLGPKGRWDRDKRRRPGNPRHHPRIAVGPGTGWQESRRAHQTPNPRSRAGIPHPLGPVAGTEKLPLRGTRSDGEVSTATAALNGGCSPVIKHHSDKKHLCGTIPTD